MVEKKAYPGTISSVILSVLVLIMLLMPFYIANNRDKLRKGEDKYEYKEVMCWDIDSNDDFDNTFNDVQQIRNYPYLASEQGTGAFAYLYWRGTSMYAKHNIISISNVDIGDEPVDGYGRTQSLYHSVGSPSYSMTPGPPAQDVFIALTVTAGDILEMDIVAIDVFFGLPGTTINHLPGTHVGGLWFRVGCNAWTGFGSDIGGFDVGKVNHLEITVDDLLKLNTFDSDDKMVLFFRWYPTEPFNGQDLINGGDVYFDMQFYNIEEIKITSIDMMGIAMTGGGIFMTFCAILMLPYVTFSSVIGKIVGKGGK